MVIICYLCGESSWIYICCIIILYG